MIRKMMKVAGIWKVYSVHRGEDEDGKNPLGTGIWKVYTGEDGYRILEGVHREKMGKDTEM